MSAFLSPLVVIHRATLLLGRNGLRMLAGAVIFGIIPAEGVQIALMHPLFADRFGEHTDMLLRSGIIVVGGYALHTLGYLIAKLAALDDLDEQRRSFRQLVLAGFGRYIRAVWLLIPVNLAGQWLTDRFGFFAGLVTIVPLFYFLTDYAVAGRNMRDSAAASVRLLKRYAFSVIASGLLLHSASYALTQGYRYFARHWSEVFLWEGQAGIAGMVLIALTDVVFAAWSVALYGALRERLEDRSLRTAAVFD